MQIIVALLVPLAFALVYVLGGLTGMLYIFVVCAHIRMSPREVAADRGPSPGVAQEGVSMDLSNTSNSGTTRALGLTVSCSLLLHQDHPLTKAGCSHCPSSLALELLSCSHWGAHPPPLLSNISQKTSARAEKAELYTKPRGVCPCPRMPEPPRSMVSHVCARSTHSRWGIHGDSLSGKWQSPSSVHWPTELWVVASVSRHSLMNPWVQAPVESET